MFGTHANGPGYLKDFDFGLNLKKLSVDITSPLRRRNRRNPFDEILSRIGGSLFNKLEIRLHPKLRSRGIEEVSKRMGVGQLRLA